MKRITIRRMSILFAMAFIMAMGIVPVNAMSLDMAPPAVTLDCCDYCAAEEATEDAARCWGNVIFIREYVMRLSSRCRTCNWEPDVLFRVYRCLYCGFEFHIEAARFCGCNWPWW